MNKHLEEANMSYWEHWKLATLTGISLIIHAWFPNILKDYASNKICKGKNK
jgi:ABC-type phosphate/phosphonate transport system permease subunit|tara:strand:+ start:170 stop:322 length:153 start_codon:yes stop_codon:yes gene_type:complete